MNPFRDPAIVSKMPLLSVGLLESANVGQLIRMWSERTSEGQSLYGWVLVNLALWGWLNFYLVFNRGQKLAIWGTALGIAMNSAVIGSVIYFRYYIGRG